MGFNLAFKVLIISLSIHQKPFSVDGQRSSSIFRRLVADCSILFAIVLPLFIPVHPI